MTKPREKKPRKSPAKTQGFSLFDDGAMALVKAIGTAATETMHKKKNRRGGFVTVGQAQQQMTRLPDFAFQYLCGSYGIRNKTVLEIIGPENTGKTTLAFDLMAQAMLQNNSLCLFIPGDGKPMSASRAARIMHSHPVTGKRMVDMVTMKEAHALHEMVEVVENWVKAARGVVPGSDKLRENHVSRDIPLWVTVEHFGKMLSKAEALGYYSFADYMSPANRTKAKQIGEGSNQGHAQFAHAFMRRMTALQDEYNFQLLLISHQNDDTSAMDGGPQTGPQFVSKEWKALRHITKNGGRATNQTASLQWVIIKTGDIVDENKEPMGIRCKMRTYKNSYGTPGREIQFEIRTVHNHDTPDYLERPIQTHKWLAKKMADNAWLGVKASDDTYSCKLLGVTGVTSEELYRALHSNQEVFDYLAKSLHFEGYDDTVNLIEEAMLEAVRKKPETPEETTEETSDEMPPPPPEED
jgi:RecA/RadA recombinase